MATKCDTSDITVDNPPQSSFLKQRYISNPLSPQFVCARCKQIQQRLLYLLTEWQLKARSLRFPVVDTHVITTKILRFCNFKWQLTKSNFDYNCSYICVERYICHNAAQEQ